MELVAPAGNLEKLLYAYRYGADAVYIGLPGFSLRARADNFAGEDYREVTHIKRQTGKPLYCALNVYFHPLTSTASGKAWTTSPSTPSMPSS